MLAPLPLESEDVKGKVYECIEEEFRWFRDVTEGNVFPIPEVTCKALTMELLTSSSKEEEGEEERTQNCRGIRGLLSAPDETKRKQENGLDRRDFR